jgi:hypothetical protein
VKHVILLLVGLSLALSTVAAAGDKVDDRAAITINYRRSACAPLPSAGEGQVRFFVQLYNAGSSAGTYQHTIHFVWQRFDGSWKDSWLNTIEKGSLRVGPRRGKVYYSDFGADPSKPIVACGLRLDASPTVRRIRVVR